MIASKGSFYYSQLLGMVVEDRRKKRVGRVADVLLNNESLTLNYLILDTKHIVPLTYVNEEDLEQKLFRISEDHSKLFLATGHWMKQKDDILLSELRITPVYDSSGELVSPVIDVAYGSSGRLKLVLGEDRLRELLSKLRLMKVRRYLVEWRHVGLFNSSKILLNVSRSQLDLRQPLDTNFDLEDEKREEKKRYIVLEAPVETSLFMLRQKEEQHQDLLSMVHVQQLDSTSGQQIQDFIDLYNFILLTSSDTYVPINELEVITYFARGTFLAYKHGVMVGYCYYSTEDTSGGLVGVICGVGVHPSQRGKKIALALLQETIRQLVNIENISTLQADVLESNGASRHLFSSLGFHMVNEVFLD